MKRQTDRAPAKIHKPVELDVKPCDYQPSKADMEEEIDMPGMSIDQIRKAFFRPFRPKQDR